MKRLKIADFGFAHLIGQKTLLHSVVGTPAYYAPEVCNRRRDGYSKPADMWSIGVILFACLCGFFPFDEERDVEEQIREGNFKFEDQYWGHISEDAVDLVANLLVVEPKQRFTVDQMLQHDWFRTSRQLNITPEAV